jgi:hypothetical protein
LQITDGGIDENVNPSSIFKLAEALIKPDKEFDILILPSQRNAILVFTTITSARSDGNYFVEHLQGAKPIMDQSDPPLFIQVPS